MDHSPPSSSVHGVLQARILEAVPFSSPGDLPDPGIEPRSPALQADSSPFEPPGKPLLDINCSCFARVNFSGRAPGEGIGYPLQYSWASLVAHMVKNPPAMQETWVRSLGWEDALEEGMATHSSILAWRIPWTEKPDGLQS